MEQFAGKDAGDVEASLLARLIRPVPGRDWAGWAVAGVIALFAAVLRLVHLDRPGRLVFDETYYVKQAYSLLTLGYEGRWEEEVDGDFAAGDFSGLSSEAAYVVHPPLGKWMIAVGMRLLGPDSAVGWRLSAAVIGALSVLMLVRIARRLFGSTVLGGVAGLLLAIDGVHLVMSRISILDIFLQFWIVAAFGALLLDREQYRRRLARSAAVMLSEHGRFTDPWGPKVGFRWWLLTSGVLAGLACGVKWSGAYALAVFGLFAVAWSLSARRAIGAPMWVGAGVIRDGIPAFFTMVPAAVAGYLAAWSSWFANPRAYYRQWAGEVNAVADEPVRTWMPDALNSLWEYHRQMWEFHRNLSSEHTYEAHPAGWLLQLRPTSFAWRTEDEAAAAMDLCGAERCAAAITSVGNPLLWWGAAFALLLVIWAALRRGDWRAWAILAGYFAGYLPWFLYADRTIFTFYTVAFAPFVAFTFTFAIAEMIGPSDAASKYRKQGIWTAAGVLILVLGVSAWFWPIWTNQWVPYSFWRVHMWLESWI